MKTLKQRDAEREIKVMKWTIGLLVGLIALMWLHFVWNVPLPACQSGEEYPCSL